jgi:hypothetical protein
VAGAAGVGDDGRAGSGEELRAHGESPGVELLLRGELTVGANLWLGVGVVLES